MNKGYKWESLGDILEKRAIFQAEKVAYSHLDENGEVEENITYNELFTISRGVACFLSSITQKGSTAILFFPPGLDFIKCLYGCFLSGIIAIPSYLPKANRSFERVEVIMNNSKAKIILTSSNIPNKSFLENYAKNRGLKLFYTDLINPSSWGILPKIKGEDIAFIQYTSGSISLPKGVIIDHHNIIHNEQLIKDSFGITEKSVIVGWLPFNHDMGLIGNVMQTLYSGCQSFLMSPITFLQKPERWLMAISKYQATVSGGPNFSYDLCLKNIDDISIKDVNLSSWKVAFNGAEKVKSETMDAFSKKFKKYGFSHSAFTPCYGLAEATLLVSVKKYGTQPIVEKKKEEDLFYNKITPIRTEPKEKAIVSCGIVEGFDLIIVDNLLNPIDNGKTGEILISGNSVTRGYFQNANNSLFIEIGGKRYFRTGDLGFLEDEQLFLTGRIKELIIINGRNYYPYDIETIAIHNIPALSPNTCAVFDITDNGNEHIVVVVECSKSIDIQSIYERIKKNIWGELELTPKDIVFIRRGTIPKTTSGKIQRLKCKEMYLDGSLRTFVISHEELTSNLADNIHIDKKIHDVIKSIADFTNIPISTAYGHPSNLGLNSIKIVQLVNHLSETFQVECHIEDFYNAPDIISLCEKIISSKPYDGSKTTNYPQKGPYELSSTQKSIWFDQQMDQNNTGYIMSTQIDFFEMIDEKIMMRVFGEIVRENEILRSCFRIIDNKLMQIPHAYPILQIIKNKQGVDNIKDITNKPFCLEKDSLMRGYLVQLSKTHFRLLLVVHHIICDGISLSLLLAELITRYNYYCKDCSYKKIISHIQFRDYVYWEKRFIQEKGEDARSYWNNLLLKDFTRINLPYDYTNTEEKDIGEGVNYEIGSSLKKNLMRFSKEKKLTINNILLGVFASLLYKISGQNDIIIGLPVANRVKPQFNSTLGLFMNVIILRINIEAENDFLVIVQKVKEGLIKGLKNQFIPLNEILSNVNKATGKNLYSLTPIFFNYLNFLPSDSKEDFFNIFRGNENMDTNIDVNFYVYEQLDKMKLRVIYKKNLFRASTIKNILKAYTTLLDTQISNTTKRLDSISILPIKEINYKEKREIISLSNGNKNTTYFTSPDIVSLIEEKVLQYKENIAYKFKSSSISYFDLNAKANYLSLILRKRGVKKGTFIPLLMDKSIELPIAILAIWKAEGAYVPMDTLWPKYRINQLLNELNPPVIILNNEKDKSLLDNRYNNITINWKDLSKETQCPSHKINRDDYIYGIYTSGTTGNPKCAINYHKGILNRLLYMNKIYNYRDNDVVLFTSKHIFDASIWQMFWPLINGGISIIPPPSKAFDIFEIIELIEQEKVTITDFVPSVFNIFVDQLLKDPSNYSKVKSLRQLLIGGEAMNSNYIKKIREILPNVGITNTYGPTEASIGTIFYEVPQSVPEIIPIGKPIDNVKALILDDNLQLLPYGKLGNLYLGGACVGAGYYSDEQRTKAVFINNPIPEIDAEIIYKTGDLAYYLNDGNIQFAGRKDHQIKINGIRIELKEVEHFIRKLTYIKDIVVIDKQKKSFTYLVAYYTSEKEVDEITFREDLKKYLPTYSIPSFFIRVEQFPINQIGKIDIKKLSEIEIKSKNDPIYANEKEKFLIEIWAEVLEINQEVITLDSNFFNLGGHSLLLIKLIGGIHEKLGVRFEINDIFNYQTIKQQAAVLDKIGTSPSLPEIKRIHKRKHYPLTFIQQKIYNLHKNKPAQQRLNIPLLLTINGKIDVDRIKYCFNELIKQHEALRASFHNVHGKLAQYIEDYVEVQIAHHKQDSSKIETLISKIFKSCFDLSKPPLFSLDILEITDKKWCLFLNIHHIISDAISIKIIMDDFLRLYKGEKLKKETIGYKDYVCWEKSFFKSDVLEKFKQNQKERFINTQFTELTTDLITKRKSYYGKEFLLIPKELLQKIDRLSHQLNVTRFTIIVGLFMLQLKRETNDNTITIGSRVSSRIFPEMQNIVGNLLGKILIQYTFSDESFSDFFIALHKKILTEINYSILPLELLDLSKNQLNPRIIVNYIPPINKKSIELNNSIESIEITELMPRYNNTLLKYDLNFFIKEYEESIELQLLYNSNKFLPKRMKSFLLSICNNFIIASN